MDSEDGSRGGSIYLRRNHEKAIRDGKESCFVLTNSIVKKLGVILESWMHGYEVRGTVPRDLATLVFCRRRCGYIQSPPEEWSLVSRIAMKLYTKLAGGKAACVSETTRNSAKEEGYGMVPIEYANVAFGIEERERGREKETRNVLDNRIIFVIMDNGLIDKGYLRHMSILEEIGCTNEIVVEVYGKENKQEYTGRGRVNYNGFSNSPFEDAKKRYGENVILYLGCSRFEGLHMAAVEAALCEIPSILSNIPAHRELERIAGYKLFIGNDVVEDVQLIRGVIDRGNYRSEAERCVQLARNFRHAGLTMMQV